MDKTKAAIELRNQLLDAEAERRNRALAAQNERKIAFTRAIAEANLAPDSILAIQLSEHPELAPVYAEAVRARSYDDRMKLQKEFEEKLSAVAATDKRLVHDLLTEGIKQIGNVMVEAQRKHRPTLVSAGAKLIEPGGEPPAPSGGQESGPKT